MGLGFLTWKKLLVADCGGSPGNDRILLYEFSDHSEPFRAEEADQTVGPIRIGDDWQQAEFQFFSMALANQTAYITTGPFALRGMILKAGTRSNRLEYLQAFLDENRSSVMHAPTGIAVSPSPRPPYLVVAQMGEINESKDSQLTFYVPTSGEKVLALGTGLHDIIGLAYSPSGQLYALDAAWKKEESGGVYRLDDARVEGRPACRPVKIAEIIRPMSLAFSSSGELYVTCLGSGQNSRQGQLLRISGDL